MEETSRTQLLLGQEGVEALARSRVAVFGVGGVGSYCVEALARAGVGALDLVDGDTFAPSNLNRQLFALRSTLGRKKVEVARERIADIFPQCTVRTFPLFFLPDTPFDFSPYDYVVDAVDTVAAKAAVIARALGSGAGVISAMGAGNKLDPTAFEVADLADTSVCPLARAVRRELKKQGILHCKTVYSRERPISRGGEEGRVPGSVSFVPSVMGLIIAGEVVKDLLIRQAKNET